MALPKNAWIYPSQVDSYKETESLLKSQLEDATASQGDVEDLRQKLAACQEKLAAYKVCFIQRKLHFLIVLSPAKFEIKSTTG